MEAVGGRIFCFWRATEERRSIFLTQIYGEGGVSIFFAIGKKKTVGFFPIKKAGVFSKVVVEEGCSMFVK
jgi:hypothetical protein